MTRLSLTLAAMLVAASPSHTPPSVCPDEQHDGTADLRAPD